MATLGIDAASYLVNGQSSDPAQTRIEWAKRNHQREKIIRDKERRESQRSTERRYDRLKQDQQREQWGMGMDNKGEPATLFVEKAWADKNRQTVFIEDDSDDPGDDAQPRQRPGVFPLHTEVESGDAERSRPFPQQTARRVSRREYTMDGSDESGDDIQIRIRGRPQVTREAARVEYTMDGSDDSGYDARSRFRSRYKERPSLKAARYNGVERDDSGSDSLDDVISIGRKPSGIAPNAFGGGYLHKHTNFDSIVSSTISRDKTSGECVQNAELLASFAQKSLRLNGPQEGMLNAARPPYSRGPEVGDFPMIRLFSHRDRPQTFEKSERLPQGYDNAADHKDLVNSFPFSNPHDIFEELDKGRGDVQNGFVEKRVKRDNAPNPGLATGGKRREAATAPHNGHGDAQIEFGIRDESPDRTSFLASGENATEVGPGPYFGEVKYVTAYASPDVKYHDYYVPSTTGREPVLAISSERFSFKGVRQYSDDGAA